MIVQRISAAACLAMALSTVCATTTPAQTTLPSVLDLHRHLEGDAWGTIWHESGHALIDLFDLKLVGHEEDIADEFATMMMIHFAKGANEDGLRHLASVVNAYKFLWESNRSITGQEFPESLLLDVHSPDLKRAYNMLCLVEGAFPERYAGNMEAVFGKPEDSGRCYWEYQAKLEAWNLLLDPLRAAGDGKAVTVTLKPSEVGSGRFYQNRYLQLTLLEEAALSLRYSFAWPIELKIVSGSCGMANAFYSPSDQMIVSCHEMMDLVADAYLSAKTGMGYEDWLAATQSEQVANLPAWLPGKWRFERPDYLPQGTGIWVDIDELVLNGDGTFTNTWADTRFGSSDVASGFYGVDGEGLWLLYTDWAEGTAANEAVRRFALNDASQAIVYWSDPAAPLLTQNFSLIATDN